MRFPVLFFLFFLFFVDSNAQSVVVENDSTGNKLSEIEFNVLKERYLNMLESKTYDLVRRMHRQIGKKKMDFIFLILPKIKGGLLMKITLKNGWLFILKKLSLSQLMRFTIFM